MTNISCLFVVFRIWLWKITSKFVPNRSLYYYHVTSFKIGTLGNHHSFSFASCFLHFTIMLFFLQKTMIFITKDKVNIRKPSKLKYENRHSTYTYLMCHICWTIFNNNVGGKKFCDRIKYLWKYPFSENGFVCVCIYNM